MKRREISFALGAAILRGVLQGQAIDAETGKLRFDIELLADRLAETTHLALEQ